MTMHPFFQRTEQLGTSDPDPEPRKHYEVHCGKCGWWGYESQLRKIYKPIPTEQGGITPELCCAMCGEAGWLEYKDNSSISLEDSVVNAVDKRWELVVAAMLVGRATEKECRRLSQLKK